MKSPRFIICPLEIEARAVLSLAEVDPARVIVCGPGGAVTAAVRQAKDAGATSILLAGFCAGLTQTLPAPAIGEVRSESGQSWRPTLVFGRSPVTLVGVDRIVATPREKAALRERTSADLADCESHHFAGACAEAGVEWGVIRAVSDGPRQTLPAESAEWIDDLGRTRAARVLLDVVRRPTLAPTLRTLARSSRRASHALREAMEEALR